MDFVIWMDALMGPRAAEERQNKFERLAEDNYSLSIPTFGHLAWS